MAEEQANNAEETPAPVEAPAPDPTYIEVETVAGLQKFDPSNPEDAKALRELAKAGMETRQARKQAKEAMEAAKADREFAKGARDLLERIPKLRTAFVQAAQTGRFDPDGQEVEAPLDGSPTQAPDESVLEIQAELRSLKSRLEAADQEKELSSLEKSVERSLNENAPWLNGEGREGLREQVKAMSLVQAEKRGVDPALAAISVAKILADGMNVNRQTEYDEIVTERERSKSVKPDEGAPTPSERVKYNREEWTPKNRHSIKDRALALIRERKGLQQ